MQHAGPGQTLGAGTIPVIALTGYLGAGKTTLLNHVLRAPGARIGVVINDFGDLNVDAGLVRGQVDEPVSITGGCICHLPDDGVLDDALEKLADPKLALDAIIVEASGVADPIAISRMIRFSGVDGVRHGGVVDVVDAVEHFGTVDTSGQSLSRYRVASLVVVNKLDLIPRSMRRRLVNRIEAVVREHNPDAQVVRAVAGRIDPRFLYDVHGGQGGAMQLSSDPLDDVHHHHVHAESITVVSDGAADPGALVDLLERPPRGVYRMKGTVAVSKRHYMVNVVGRSAHVTTAPAGAPSSHLVAIGTDFDLDEVRSRLQAALYPSPRKMRAADMRRLQRLRLLSV